jgi:hypothetical protein
MVSLAFGGITMTSTAQVSANRANAPKSTGPRTPEGKAAVAQNAVRHGLLAQEVVIKGEDPGEFEFYRDQMLEELAPVGQMESMLAQRIVGLAWRLRRAERLQAAAFDKLEDPSKPPEWVLSPEQASRLLAVLAETGVQPPEPVAAGPGAGRRAVQDFDRERILDRLLVYERRIESSLYRTMGELRKLRLLREAESLAAGAMAEEGLPRSTGVPPTATEDIHGQACPELAEWNGRDTHGRDGRATHGRDAHATEPPCGGTTNGAETEMPSRQTNPICAGSNVGGTPNRVDTQEPACETNPISAAAKKDPVPYVPIFRRRR